jgi:hypothetical protein
MENNMKEIQNDTMAIERKNVDATRATKIHASVVISNNKPRDNYLAFDARKFCPLVLTNDRLEKSMTPEKINMLTNKVADPTKDTFDKKYIAQIAQWVKKNGKSSKWPNLEYRGPMFYRLAHTSMTRWQKRAAMIVMEFSETETSKIITDKKKGMLWSSLEEYWKKKSGSNNITFPDNSSIQFFFDNFLDTNGKKCFATTAVPRDLMSDFWVKMTVKQVSIATEAEVIKFSGGYHDDEEDLL